MNEKVNEYRHIVKRLNLNNKNQSSGNVGSHNIYLEP